MKKLTALVVLLTLVGTASFASSGPLGENSKFTVIEKADTKFELIYVSSEEGDVRVSILDETGRNIESNTVKHATKFRRTFDFSKLEPGKYSIVVKNAEGTSREEVTYLPAKNMVKLQTFVAKIPDSKSVKVHVGDFNKDEPVYVRIYNEKDKVIHKDEIIHSTSFSKVYNLKKAKSGEFRVLIENDGEMKSFVYKIED